MCPKGSDLPKEPFGRTNVILCISETRSIETNPGRIESVRIIRIIACNMTFYLHFETTTVELLGVQHDRIIIGYL